MGLYASVASILYPLPLVALHQALMPPGVPSAHQLHPFRPPRPAPFGSASAAPLITFLAVVPPIPLELWPGFLLEHPNEPIPFRPLLRLISSALHRSKFREVLVCLLEAIRDRKKPSRQMPLGHRLPGSIDSRLPKAPPFEFPVQLPYLLVPGLVLQTRGH